MVTGDSDDPNSTDQTLDGFIDDLTISLDTAYIKYRPVEKASILGGKFENPFLKTDMV